MRRSSGDISRLGLLLAQVAGEALAQEVLPVGADVLAEGVRARQELLFGHVSQRLVDGVYLVHDRLHLPDVAVVLGPEYF
jgi:hypothetical protein